MSDVEEFNAFKSGKIKTEEMPHELFSHESFDQNSDLRRDYEERIKDKIDISNVPSDLKLEFLS
ncbi:hypothetical protein HMPREF1544_06302 [Mucor circinelloides 1006PhL]|uniref:Uncharacterized protein n=1 Tax=Mucor circinelloides f. circinelloides (strain 1006PhL) TaxID=1220926 RepID=S2J9S0_MUCC1|nr:hypothetical protein HMPREF1544_06302 [Mucor circinelloides 1006PhL]